MTHVELRSAAWYGDEPLTLRFPTSWQVVVLGPERLTPLTPDLIRRRVAEPIGTERLSTIAAGRKRAALIVDDLTRPTPTEELLPPILDELAAGGIRRDAISVVLAGGTHTPASRDEVAKKLAKWARELRILPHHAQRDLRYLGKSSRGTPIYVNAWILECDLKIGVGGVYPHDAAGFSGGSKIVVPGVCGFETARYLHQNLRGSGVRGGSLDTEMRRDIEEIAGRIGLDFIVNAVITPERRVAAAFAGEKVLAFQEAVGYATAQFAIDDAAILARAHIVIVDTYPFDTTLQFATTKGMWPVANGHAGSQVALAACPLGVGHHELYPVSLPIWKRAVRRMRRLRLRDLPRLAARARGLRRGRGGDGLELWLLSTGLGTRDLARAFPNGRLFRSWDAILTDLMARHEEPQVPVAIYRCAPLLLRQPGQTAVPRR